MIRIRPKAAKIWKKGYMEGWPTWKVGPRNYGADPGCNCENRVEIAAEGGEILKKGLHGRLPTWKVGPPKLQATKQILVAIVLSRVRAP